MQAIANSISVPPAQNLSEAMQKEQLEVLALTDLRDERAAEVRLREWLASSLGAQQLCLQARRLNARITQAKRKKQVSKATLSREEDPFAHRPKIAADASGIPVKATKSEVSAM